MIWDNLVQSIKGIFDNSNDKEWLKNLVDDLEQKISEDKTLPFRINHIKEKGFIIKINGLFGFVSFYHMPWIYDDLESWKYVFKYLQNKTFFCKIHKFEKEPLSITINGDVPQFRKLSLIKDLEYNGVIIKKTHYGLVIDLGFHFNWQCGSFVQLIHKSNIDKSEYSELKCGDIFRVFYEGETDENLATFKSENKINCEELIGKMVKVEIKKNFNNQFTYLIEGKYKGTMPVNKEHYPNRKKYVRQALRNLNGGETIHCEVVNITKNKQLLQLKWIIESEIEQAFEREPSDIVSINAAYNIQTRLDNEISDKLRMIGKLVDVEVIKKEDQNGRLYNKYLVNNKFQGVLLIANENYHITDKEKTMIEKNFQDNEMLKCTVLSIEGNKAKVKWEISDTDFLRFIGNE
ncbi:MAG: hypothetical protein RBR35_17360 [Salinivirgaceae bacterium]|nr:hypothetical protein [Salinivirgaceae bacterium]